MSSMNITLCIITKRLSIENMYATCISLLTQEMIAKRTRLPYSGEWGQDTSYIHQSSPPSVRHTISVDAFTYNLGNLHNILQWLQVITTCCFFKECPIPISSVPISSTSSSGTSKLTRLTLILQLYKKPNEIRQKLLIKNIAT